MKSLKYLAIAVAVAGVAMTATPADAGSVGVKGGKVNRNVDVVEQRDNKYTKDHVNELKDVKWEKDKEEKGTDKKTKLSGKLDARYTGTSSTKYQVNVYAVHDLYGGNGAWQHSQTRTFDNTNQVYGAWNDMAINATAAGRDGFSQHYVNGNGNVMGYGYSDYAGRYCWCRLGENVSLSGWSQSGSAATKTGTEEVKVDSKDRRDYVRTDVVGTSDETKYVNTTEKFDYSDTKFTGRTYSFNDGSGILIGDVDNMSKAYAATDVSYTDHYLKTNHWLLTKNYDHTVYTHKQKVYNNYKENFYKDRDVYKRGNVTYTANFTVSVTPIVLDLDGDGKIEASNGQYLPHKGDFSKNVVLFDFYGNGFPVAMEWVGTNDGLLCRPDADGVVKGTNLFGSANGYENGYDELASLDVNKDGQLTGAELTGLMVWQDENHNGVSEKGELKSLESLGITSIAARHNNLKGTYTRNGKIYKSFDWHPTVQQLRKKDIAH